MFVGYSKQSKFYRVYIPSYRQIEINIFVALDENATFRNSRKNHPDEDHEEEHRAPRVTNFNRFPVRDVEEDHISEYHDMKEPQIPMDSPFEMPT